jgi:hypothetical protein
MLTFRQLDDAGDAVVRLIAQTEQVLLDDMARRIARLDGMTAATNWQALRLELLGTAREKVIAELARALDMTKRQVIELFDEAATRTIAADDRMFRAAGYTPVPLEENPYLQQIIRAGLVKTMEEYHNLTLTTANTATRQFEGALDLAHQLIVSGGYTYQQAIRDGIHTLTASGIESIRYPTGWVDYLDVAFRRAALTGVNQTAAEIQLANLSQMGADLVETTAHPGARPDHAVWQGRVFSVSGTHDKYPDFRHETGYGEGWGLCGWNCRHNFFPFFEGLSDPAYAADKLREYNGKMVTYNGKEMSLYDATQQQRYIERQIRRWKREASALDAAGQDNTAAMGKMRQWQARQRDFIDQTGLRRDYFRERAGTQFTSSPGGVKITDIVERAVGAKQGASMDVTQAATGANPSFAYGTEYAVNCQRCVPTYEFRRRGYDVTAKPKPTGENKYYGSEPFVNAAGNPVHYSFRQTEAAVKRELNAAPDGARYGIYIKWKGHNNDAHVFVAEKIAGGVNYFDPQNGNMDVSAYFADGRRGRFGFLRMDNLSITTDENILQDFMEGKKP